MEKCTDVSITHVKAMNLVGMGNEEQPGVQLDVFLSNDSAYEIAIRFQDGMVLSARYLPKGTIR